MKKNKSPNVETFYIVKKLSMMEYQLIKLRLENEILVDRQVIKSDIPGIVVGYYLKAIRDQQIGE